MAGCRRSRALDMGNDDPRLRRRRVHDVSPSQGRRARRLSQYKFEKTKTAFGRSLCLDWQAFCSAPRIAMHSYRPCTIAEQQMTRQHHLKTADVERSNRAQAKKRAIEERRHLIMIDALHRMRQRTEAVL